MKLNTTLPSKYLTEGNPVIGLSFEVGYRRMLVMVGETIIFKMSNMIRTDVDSEICNCIPAYMYRSHMSDAVLANKHQEMGGGFRRTGADTLEVRSAHTPMDRSHFAHKGEVLDYSEAALEKDVGFLQATGRAGYGSFTDFSSRLLESRRQYKAFNHPPRLEDVDRMHRFLNSPYLYANVGTVGHIDYGRYPSYLTKAMYEKQMREAGIEVDAMAEPDYTIRKLHNNGSHAGPSGHSSLTAMCRNYKLTDMHGDRGVIPRVKVAPVVHDYTSMSGRMPAIIGMTGYVRNAVFRRVEAYLTDKYYFTGEGMLPKDL